MTHGYMIHAAPEAVRKAVCMLPGYHPLQVHAKAVLKDVEGAVPDEAPMMIWDDEIELGWSSDEIEGLREMGGFEARPYIYTYYGVLWLRGVPLYTYYGLLWFTMVYYGFGAVSYTHLTLPTTAIV